MSDDDTLRRLREEPDFVHCKRLGNSLARIEERYEEACPDEVVAAVLCLKEEEVAAEYARIVAKMRGLMGVKE